jgi:glycosyltransferase involved in cell wall biosynthesis
MKILHTISVMDPKMGGVSQAVRTIASSLNELGTSNEVVCLDSPSADFLKNDKLTIHALGPAKSPWLYSASLEPWLNGNLHQYDAVIIHGLWQFQSHATAKAVRQLRRKGKAPTLYVMPHGMLDPYFQKAEGRKLKALRNYIYWKFMERRVINDANGMLFTCEEEMQLARIPFSPYKPAKEFVVGLGVDEPPVFSAAIEASFKKLGKDKRSYLLFLSRLHEKKGVDLLIKAFGTAKDKSLKALVVAGPGLDQPYGKSLQTLAGEAAHNGKSIDFIGMISGDYKWATIYNSEAFVLPSHQENFGIAVVEALACGRPVLISDKVNIWREIADAKCGLIATDTLEGASDMLKRWSQLSEQEKADMGQRARELYKASFSVPEAARRFLKAITAS